MAAILCSKFKDSYIVKNIQTEESFLYLNVHVLRMNEGESKLPY